MFCYKCGAEIPDESMFCLKCGADLSAVKDEYVTENEEVDISPEIAAEAAAEIENEVACQDDICIDVDIEPDDVSAVGETETITETVTVIRENEVEETKSDYRVIITSIGSCPALYADDVICDVLGYEPAEARTIISMLPAEVARYLTSIQATVIAQALSEYGMLTAVYDSNGYSGTGMRLRDSVYNADGTLKASAIKVLGTLTALNLLKRFKRWRRFIDITHIFKQSYHRTPPSEWRRPRNARIQLGNETRLDRRVDKLEPAHTSIREHGQPQGGGRGGGHGRPGGQKGPGGGHRH